MDSDVRRLLNETSKCTILNKIVLLRYGDTLFDEYDSNMCLFGSNDNDPDILYNCLIYFSGLNDSKVVKVLLSHGADPNISDKYRHTPLMVACRNGSVECAKLLLAPQESSSMMGADVNAQTHYGRTALMCASVIGDTSIVKLLLAPRELSSMMGADVNIVCTKGHYTGYTAIDFAYMRRHYDIVTLLTKASANEDNIPFVDKITYN